MRRAWIWAFGAKGYGAALAFSIVAAVIVVLLEITVVALACVAIIAGLTWAVR